MKFPDHSTQSAGPGSELKPPINVQGTKDRGLHNKHPKCERCGMAAFPQPKWRAVCQLLFLSI